MKTIVVCCISILCWLPLSFGTSHAVVLEDTELGYQVDYPAGWDHFKAGQTLFIINFPEFRHGGLLPAGGTSISIQVVPSDESDDTVLDRLLAKDSKRTTESLSGRPVRNMQWTHQLGEEEYYSVARVVTVGKKHFLIICECHADDLQRAKWESEWEDIASSLSMPTGRNVQ
jgi:hypothetical protein